MSDSESSQHLLKTIINLKEFDDFYHSKLKPKLFEKYSNEPECIVKIIKRFDLMVDYNTPHGKKLRGYTAFESLAHLIDPQKLDELNYNHSNLINEAKAIGWCIEFVHFI
jgi:hypothetical protein